MRAPWPSTTTTSAPHPRSRRSRKAASRPSCPAAPSSPCSSNCGTPTTPPEADWALATTAYNRIAAELTGVDGEGRTIRIVLDDGLPHTDND